MSNHPLKHFLRPHFSNVGVFWHLLPQPLPPSMVSLLVLIPIVIAHSHYPRYCARWPMGLMVLFSSIKCVCVEKHFRERELIFFFFWLKKVCSQHNFDMIAFLLSIFATMVGYIQKIIRLSHQSLKVDLPFATILLEQTLGIAQFCQLEAVISHSFQILSNLCLF